MKQIKIVSWNINSIRARMSHLSELVNKISPDVVLLQEVRCSVEKFPHAEIEDMGFNVAFNLGSHRNGVAILSKYPLEDVSSGFIGQNLIQHGKHYDIESIEENRYIEAFVKFPTIDVAMQVASVYVPNGGVSSKESNLALGINETERFKYKIAFFKDLAMRCAKFATQNIFIGGDFNVALNDMDVYDPKKFAGQLSCHDDERRAFGEFINSGGFVDLFRSQNRNKIDFTWWDYRQNSYTYNKGLRLDYVFSNTANLTKNIFHLKEYRELDRPSDHCPVMVVIGGSTP